MNTNLNNEAKLGPRSLEALGVIGASIFGVGLLLIIMATANADLDYQIGPLALNVATATILGIIAVPMGLLVVIRTQRLLRLRLN